jgi:hypothetical protein
MGGYVVQYRQSRQHYEKDPALALERVTDALYRGGAAYLSSLGLRESTTPLTGTWTALADGNPGHAHDVLVLAARLHQTQLLACMEGTVKAMLKETLVHENELRALGTLPGYVAECATYPFVRISSEEAMRMIPESWRGSTEGALSYLVRATLGRPLFLTEEHGAILIMPRAGEAGRGGERGYTANHARAWAAGLEGGRYAEIFIPRIRLSLVGRDVSSVETRTAGESMR